MSGIRIKIKEVYLYNANTSFMVESIFSMMGFAGCLLIGLGIIAFVLYWAFIGLMFIIGSLMALWGHIKNK